MLKLRITTKEMRLKFFLRKSAIMLMGLLFLLPSAGHCESVVHDEFGGMLGVSLSFGTIRQRLGIIAKGYYAGSDYQANMEVGVHYNFASFGPPLSGPEIRAGLGGVFAWGDKDKTDNVFLSPVSNQTGARAFSWTH